MGQLVSGFIFDSDVRSHALKPLLNTVHILNINYQKPMNLSAAFVFAAALVGFANACLQSAAYTNCTTAAAQTSANCNSLVVDTPTVEYYQCLCTAGESNLQCFALCPEDAQLQLQFQTIKKSISASCQGVTDLKSQGYTTQASPTSSSSSATPSTDTSISTWSSPSFTTIPPTTATSQVVESSKITSSASSSRAPAPGPAASGSAIFGVGGKESEGWGDKGGKVNLPQANLPVSQALQSKSEYALISIVVSTLFLV
ncbi:hypothetical protein BJ741DRAFT_589562 [Chytriomyces cf. hyalinus JEL632]|nr:hypothetical protein BJ741DRAFT_589562 [Chytriomyces cf. hyalinus JEL632]